MRKWSISKLLVASTLALPLLFSCIFCSCNSNKQDSCQDKSLELVLAKKSVYENYTRSEWLQLPDSLQRAVYSVMTPSAKYKFWQDKMQEVKNLDWSQDELGHIESLSDYINNHSKIFEKDFWTNASLSAEFEDFIKDWRDIASKDLGWSQDIQYCIAAYGGTLDNHMLSDLRDGGTITGISNTYCNCSQKSDWCGGKKKCSKATCISSLGDGCGTLFLYVCDGGCF